MRREETPSAKAAMLIRRPVSEVFQAFVDPEITTKFWFTKSSGKLEPHAEVQWTWEMYGVSATVNVKEIEANSRIQIEWGDDDPSQVEWRFVAGEGDTTFVKVTETGFAGSRDEIMAHVIDSTAGFTMVLCALKALLEHDIRLTVVADAHPEGFDV